MSNTPQLPWQDKVQSEVMNFVGAVQSNFQHGLDLAVAFAPDQKDPRQRAEVLDMFMEATCGLVVGFASAYWSSGEEMEKSIHKVIADKFEHVRKKEAAIAAAQERSELKPKLVVT